MVALWVRKVRGAILIGIIAASVLAIVVEAVGNLGAAGAKNPGGWALSIPKLDGGVFEAPDFSTLGEFNLFGAFSSIEGGVLAALLLVFTLRSQERRGGKEGGSTCRYRGLTLK